IGEFDNGGLAINVAEVAIVAVHEFPQQDGLGVCLAEIRRVRDVEREYALATSAEGAYEYGVPNGVEKHVAHGQATVDIRFVRVVLCPQSIQIRVYRGWQKSQGFLAGLGIEGVQHAVVGADVHHGSAVGVSMGKGSI